MRWLVSMPPSASCTLARSRRCVPTPHPLINVLPRFVAHSFSQGREILEGLVNSGFSSHTLLFNLATMYELCTDKNRNLKTRLAERVAEMDKSPRGWEKTTADFKL